MKRIIRDTTARLRTVVVYQLTCPHCEVTQEAVCAAMNNVLQQAREAVSRELDRYKTMCGV